MTLVLGRRCGESIQIGKDITVTIVRDATGAGGTTRIGIDAPKYVNIVRTELLDGYAPSVVRVLTAAADELRGNDDA